MRIYSVIEMVSKLHRLVSTAVQRRVSLPFLFCFTAACVGFSCLLHGQNHQTPSQQQLFTLNPPSLFAT